MKAETQKYGMKGLREKEKIKKGVGTNKKMKENKK